MLSRIYINNYILLLLKAKGLGMMVKGKYIENRFKLRPYELLG